MEREGPGGAELEVGAGGAALLPGLFVEPGGGEAGGGGEGEAGELPVVADGQVAQHLEAVALSLGVLIEAADAQVALALEAMPGEAEAAAKLPGAGRPGQLGGRQQGGGLGLHQAVVALDLAAEAGEGEAEREFLAQREDDAAGGAGIEAVLAVGGALCVARPEAAEALEPEAGAAFFCDVRPGGGGQPEAVEGVAGAALGQGELGEVGGAGACTAAAAGRNAGQDALPGKLYELRAAGQAAARELARGLVQLRVGQSEQVLDQRAAGGGRGVLQIVECAAGGSQLGIVDRALEVAVVAAEQQQDVVALIQQRGIEQRQGPAGCIADRVEDAGHAARGLDQGEELFVGVAAGLRRHLDGAAVEGGGAGDVEQVGGAVGGDLGGQDGAGVEGHRPAAERADGAARRDAAADGQGTYGSGAAQNGAAADGHGAEAAGDDQGASIHDGAAAVRGGAGEAVAAASAEDQAASAGEGAGEAAGTAAGEGEIAAAQADAAGAVEAADGLVEAG